MNLPSPDAFLLEKICQPFRQATGLPMEFHLPGEFSVGEDPALPPFCRVMSLGPRAGSACRAFHLGLQECDGDAKTAACFAGLTSSALPVRKNGEMLGYLHLGHAYVDRAPGCGRPGKGCMLPGRQEAGCACAGACRQTLCLSQTRYDGAVGLARILAERIADFHQPVLSGKPFPAIDHAVRQMRGDAGRRWRLTELARRAGMNPTYFSEKFRERTGRTLTAFLAELRVGRARQLIAFTALPLSDIAFASGFRSLSQFNRVFKTVTGRAPGDHRRGMRRAPRKKTAETVPQSS